MSRKKDHCPCCGLDKSRGYYKTDKGLFFFTFNWVGGGFNQEYAKTQAQAIRQAESGTLKVDKHTINKCTESEMKGWYRSGWLATI